MSRHRRRRSSGGGRAVRATVAVIIIAGGMAGVIAGVHPAPKEAVASTDIVEIHSAHRSSLVPALRGKRPLFILALGSDARPGQAIGRLRSDSIHIIGVDLLHHRASILGFPRDSWVSIPGHGVGRINTAMTFGGPPLLIRTIEHLTGIRIDLWLLTSFPGLAHMVQGIGGITLRVPYPMHDRFSHANFSKGVHHLQGWQALAFARDRHDVPGGDISRSKDQGILLMAALAKLHDSFRQNPSVVFRWVAVGWRNVRTNLSFGTLVELGLTASQIPPSNVNNFVVPVSFGREGAAAVVFIRPNARSLYADMRNNGVIGH